MHLTGQSIITRIELSPAHLQKVESRQPHPPGATVTTHQIIKQEPREKRGQALLYTLSINKPAHIRFPISDFQSSLLHFISSILISVFPPLRVSVKSEEKLCIFMYAIESLHKICMAKHGRVFSTSRRVHLNSLLDPFLYY
jgi:hypothetical protein